MMKAFLIILMVIMTQAVKSQSVGIGTSTPDAKALLDIRSTTKGLLIPSMTTSQRLAITSSTPAPSGLMVYDTDRDEFYHYNGSSWSAILNGTYWTRPISSRKRISNNVDSVGIGTVSPTEWLDVDGNIRSRNNLMADNNVTAAGNIVGGNIITAGNLLVSGVSTLSGNVITNSNLSVGGTSLLTGDVTTNSDLIVNNPAATLQLKNSNVNKGFFQLSGATNNVRLGTNSGNATGNVIIRMNGNDRVQIDPAGDINIEGKITRTAVTGFNNLLPLSYGQVNENGTIRSGSGNFTVLRTGPGEYEITCQGVTVNSIVVVSTSFYQYFVHANPFPNKIYVSTYDAYFEDYYNANFHFIVYQPN